MYVGVGGRGYIPILWQVFFVFFCIGLRAKQIILCQSNHLHLLTQVVPLNYRPLDYYDCFLMHMRDKPYV